MPTVSLDPLFSAQVRHDPFAYYRSLHELGAPVLEIEQPARYQYLLCGFDAASQALRDPAFQVLDGTMMTVPPSWEQRRTHAVFCHSMMFTNPPRQTLMRRLFAHTFTPRRIMDLEPQIDEISTGLLDAMARRAAAGEPVDFMRDYAFPMPAAVLGRLLGVPDEDLPWYRPRAAELAKVIELGGGTEENMRRADRASEELTDYFAEMVARRRARPTDDLITALVQAQAAEQDQLTDRELLSNLVVVFNAGFVTTVHLLGNGLTLLLERPELFERVLADRSVLPSYIDEILRCQGPTHFVVRKAVTDVEVCGTPIPAESEVLVLLSAANRDPSRFVDPDRFDPDRPQRPHLAFSSGAHYCLGAALAKMEGERGFTALLDRFPGIRLAVEPPVPHQLMLRGHEQLWVGLEAGAPAAQPAGSLAR
ncbi:cytochrome P450 [Catellatospora sp. TT07R-123]|uniref:cytochrome P450 n=1 Tax=Catellatospora sp. TT07R-123 TaxID=2733863 RepID=UPI001B0C60D2|nr:cytochrome P450 [Catellatospora sp. TT07R-123]GHJ49454.1 cytochrome P450 [Catellatospora sp. TT07R-123]